MRKRKLLSQLRTGLFNVIVFFVMTLFLVSPTYAHIISKPGADCHALLVHLYKGKPATASCLLTETQYQMQVHSTHLASSPNIKSEACTDGNALWLYRKVNNTGPCIGFIGNGTAFLTDYTIPNTGGISWNDHVSSFFSGCSNGLFSEDNTIPLDIMHGFAAFFNPFTGGDFPYSDGTGTVRNFSLTGIVLDSNCGA